MTPYLIQNLLILLAPALFAASIYMVLGRLIRLLEADDLSIIRVNWLTKIFVLGDVLSFLAQSGGGGMLAKAKTADDQKRGNNIILGGLGIQVVFFGLFIVTTIIFHLRINKQPTARSNSVTVPWRRFIMVLYATSIFIMVRSLFRMAEFGMGSDGVLQSNEVYLFVLDGLLMLLVTLAFLWYHPGDILVGYKSVEAQPDLESRIGSRGENFPMVGDPAARYLSPYGRHKESQSIQTYDSDRSPARKAHGRRSAQHEYSPARYSTPVRRQ